MSLLARKQHINAVVLKWSRLSNHLRIFPDSCIRNICDETSYQQRPQLEPLIPNVHTINELHPRPLLPSARPLSLVPVYHLHETFVPRFQKCEKNRLIIGITIPITNALISNRDHSTLSRCKHSQQQQQLQPQLKALLITLTGSLRRVITVVNNNKRAFATGELRESFARHCQLRISRAPSRLAAIFKFADKL